MKHVLVTGAGGFIGRSLVPILTSRGYTVRSTRRSDLDLNKTIDPSIFRDVEAVVHLASKIGINDSLENPAGVMTDNFLATRNLFEAIRLSGEKPLVVLTSTDRMYGRTKKSLVDERDTVFPIEPYTASKIQMEVTAQLYASLYDIPYIVLRLDSVYGPGQPREMFISDVIQKMLRDDLVTTGPLTIRKNFVYVDDVSDAICAALAAPEAHRNTVYNIGGESLSLRALAKTIRAAVRKHTGRAVALAETAVARRSARAEVRAFRLSTAKAARTLKWKPRTTIMKGIENTVEYFAHHG